MPIFKLAVLTATFDIYRWLTYFIVFTQKISINSIFCRK